MRKLILFLFLIRLSFTFAQSYSDGCMRVRFTATQAWNEEYEDPFANDESNWQWWFSDVGNFDAAGWSGGNCLAQGGFWQIGWWDHTDATIFDYTYGTAGPLSASVPQTFNLRGHYEGDDCGGSCDYCTSLFDDDDYRFDETVSSGINYRFGPPNSNNTFQSFTNWHGSSDYGGEFYVNYSAPRPTVSASTTQICTGTTTAVTLNFTGAIFGGSYVVIDGGSTIYDGTAASTVVNISTAKSYNVYTKNGGTLSLCFSTISISAVNCNFHCDTKSNVAWGGNYDWSQGTATPTSYGTGTAAGQFPSNTYINDVDVAVNFIKTDGSCAAPLSGLSYHNETYLRLDQSSLGSVSLVDGNFVGNTALTTYITINFDEDASTGVSGHDVLPSSNGIFLNPIGNLDDYKWDLLPTTNWNMWGGDAVNLDPLCTNNYSLTVCGCKTADNGLAAVNGNTSGITICANAGGTITLSHNGSTTAKNNNGFGTELKWYSGSCGGAYLGSGITYTLPSPTSTTTYYCSYYVDGEPCRGSNTFCESITVTVDPISVGGTTAPSLQTICVSSSVSNISLAGNTGSILRWEYSSDGGGSWTTASGSSTSSSYNPTPYAGTSGIHLFRAIVKNGVCDEVPSSVAELEVKANPIAGTVVGSTNNVCTNTNVSFTANAFLGDLQWQVSTTSAIAGFSNISGQTSPNYNETLINAGSSLMNYWYRTAISNTPCASPVYSTAFQVTVDPIVVAGNATADQILCLDENAVAVNLSGNNAPVTHWEIDDNTSFSSPANIAVTSTTLAGSFIDSEIGSNTNITLYVRAVADNACPSNNSSYSIVRYNQPEPIVLANATGTCEANNAGTWVHIYDPSTNRLICSINDNGQNLGDVTASIYYHGGSSFTVPTYSGSCGNQAVLNRNFVINSVNPINASIPVGIRLYFTDAELANLITLAGCGDPNGCEDDDDVCGIADLLVTQIHGASNEDGTFTLNDGTSVLHNPANSGTGNNFFGANYLQFNATQFSEFWIHGSEHNTALPVELTEFTAKAINNQFIKLNWTTTTEINNEGFELHRSLDGFHFEKIAWIPGNGNSTALNFYSYQDNNVSNGVYYYRLKQVDFDGSYAFSEIRAASIVGKDNSSLSFFIPNPAEESTKLNFSLSKDSKVEIQIYDATGKLVFSEKTKLEAGVRDYNIPIESWAAGSYSANIIIENEVFIRKLVVKR
jgi:hypothetical protein